MGILIVGIGGDTFHLDPQVVLWISYVVIQ